MPLYEYRCEECEALSEILQRVDDPPAETCPECGGTLKKLISAPAFQFKGTGWYVTDYARGGKAEGSGAESSSASDAKGDSGAESDGGAKSEGGAKEPGKDSAKAADTKSAKSAAAGTA